MPASRNSCAATPHPGTSAPVKLPSYNLYPYVVYYICKALFVNDIQVVERCESEG